MSQLANIPDNVRSKLAQLRRLIVSWIVIDGLAKLCLWLVALIFISLIVDRSLRLDTAERAVLLVLGLGLLGMVVYRRIIRPMSRVLDDDTLIVRVEREHPELADQLISAVQFSRIRERASRIGVSEGLLDATIQMGTQAASGLDFGRVIDRPARNRNLIQAGIVILLLIAAFGLRPDLMNLWFQRNVVLSAVEWPRSVHLEVMGADEGVLSFPRGDDLLLRVLVADTSEATPNSVQVSYQFEDGARGSEVATRTVDDDGRVIFQASFANVISPLSVRATGLDGDTGWVEVRLVERPSVQSINLTVIDPEYTGRGRIQLDPEESSFYVLEGASLQLDATANKPLADAHVIMPGRSEVLTITEPELQPSVDLNLPVDLVSMDVEISMKVAAAEEEGRPTTERLSLQLRRDQGQIIVTPLQRPRGIAIEPEAINQLGNAESRDIDKPFSVKAGETIRFQIIAPRAVEEIRVIRSGETLAAALEGEAGFSLRLSPDQIVNGSYAIDLADTTGPGGTAGLTSRIQRRFAIRVTPDREPNIRARLSGVGDKVLTTAMIPMELRISDDFKIVNVRLAHREETFSDSAPEPTVVDLPELADLLPAEMPIEERVVFDIMPLEMQVDQHLTFEVVAIDNDQINGQPQPYFEGTTGKLGSHNFTVRIVSEDELRSDLLTREQQFRMDFSQQLRRQQELLDETTILRNLVRDGQLDDDIRRTLIRLEKDQRLLSNRVSAIADQFAGIVEEVDNNRLEDADGVMRLRIVQQIIEPLRSLASARGGIVAAANELDLGRQRFSDREALAERLDQATRRQAESLDRMRDILAAMANSELYQSALNMARQVLDQQRRVKRETDREYETQVEESDIFD